MDQGEKNKLPEINQKTKSKDIQHNTELVRRVKNKLKQHEAGLLC